MAAAVAALFAVVDADAEDDDDDDDDDEETGAARLLLAAGTLLATLATFTPIAGLLEFPASESLVAELMLAVDWEVRLVDLPFMVADAAVVAGALAGAFWSGGG